MAPPSPHVLGRGAVLGSRNAMWRFALPHLPLLPHVFECNSHTRPSDDRAASQAFFSTNPFISREGKEGRTCLGRTGAYWCPTIGGAPRRGKAGEGVTYG